MQFQKETLTEQQKGCNIRRTLVLITRTGDKYMKNGEKKILSEKVADMLRTKINKQASYRRTTGLLRVMLQNVWRSAGDRCGRH